MDKTKEPKSCSACGRKPKCLTITREEKGTGWCSLNNYCGWLPIEPAEKPKVYTAWDVAKGESETVVMEIDARGHVQKIITPKLKEQKMKIGIFKFTVRRYVMACTLIVTAKIAIALNPVVSLWDRVIPPTEGMSPYHNTAMNWFFTLAAIAAIIAAVYAYNKATAWLFGESTK